MKISSCLVMLLMLNLFLSCTGNDADQGGVQKTEMAESEAVAVDPVCEMKVKTEDAQWTAEHNGETYYFCMEGHKDDFLADPDQYLVQN